MAQASLEQRAPDQQHPDQGEQMGAPCPRTKQRFERRGGRPGQEVVGEVTGTAKGDGQEPGDTEPRQQSHHQQYASWTSHSQARPHPFALGTALAPRSPRQ